MVNAMSNVNFIFDNGDILIDKVTGLTGVVMVRAEYSTGCHHYGIQPRVVNNAREPEWTWFDQSRLELVERSAVTFSIKENIRSGAFPPGPKA